MLASQGGSPSGLLVLPTEPTSPDLVGGRELAVSFGPVRVFGRDWAEEVRVAGTEALRVTGAVAFLVGDESDISRFAGVGVDALSSVILILWLRLRDLGY